jgi:putative redox protein
VSEPAEPESGYQVSARIGAQGFSTELRARGHVLHADEPVASGGSDSGPSPYDYLLFALGSCTAMTLRIFAERRRWPLEGVEVKLRHSRVHAQDGADSENGGGHIELIERVIELYGPLDDEQRRRLLLVAEHCPVHRTLSGPMKIVTQLKTGSTR